MRTQHAATTLTQAWVTLVSDSSVTANLTCRPYFCVFQRSSPYAVLVLVGRRTRGAGERSVATSRGIRHVAVQPAAREVVDELPRENVDVLARFVP